MKNIARLTLFTIFTFSLLGASSSQAITLYMNNENLGVDDGLAAWTPAWEIINDSSQAIAFGSTEYLTASIAWESSAVPNPSLYFSPDILDGYTIDPGESIGSLNGNDFLTPKLPAVTYLINSGTRLFEFRDNFSVGQLSGTLNLSLYNSRDEILDSVDIAIKMDIVENGGPFSTLNTNVPTSPPTSPVPEPSTIILLGSGLLGLGWYGRKRRKA